MFAQLRFFALPFLSVVFLMIASGFFNTFVSIRLELAEYGYQEIGIVTAMLYGGILLGSLRSARFISKMGHASSFMIFASILAVLVLAQSFWVHAWYWSFLRFLGGICTAGIFIAMESWLLLQSPPTMRGTILSIYLIIFYAALSFGQWLIDIPNVKSMTPYLLTALLLALAAIPVSFCRFNQPKTSPVPHLHITQLYQISSLGFFGAIVSGMLLACIYGLVPVYAKKTGMDLSEIGTFMAMLVFGGLSFQWPLGRWGDKADRRKVLAIVSFITALLSLCLALLSPSRSLHLLLAWAFGGFAFTLYPLSMAYICEKVKDDKIVAVTGSFILVYGLGAITGPIIAPFAMETFGSSGLFYFLAAIATCLGSIGLKKPNLKKSVASHDTSPTKF